MRYHANDLFFIAELVLQIILVLLVGAAHHAQRREIRRADLRRKFRSFSARDPLE